jgi:opacity protein-like surface antigen
VKKLKTLLLGTVAVITIAGVHTAKAGDLPVKAQPPATPAAYAWTGWYVGVTGGLAHGQYDTTSSFVSGISTPTVADPATLNAAGRQAIKQTGFATGIEGGYNWQAGNWVLGLEGDLQALHLQKASNSNSVAVPFTTMFGPAAFTFSSYGNADWLLTARPRIGYVTPNHWLVYATGGLAVTQLQTDFVYSNELLNFNFPSFESGRVNTLKAGYVAGAGIEAPLTGRLSLKAEYLHVGFGNTAGQMTGNSGLESFSPAPVFSHSSDLKADIVRAGLNYRFGDAGAASLDTPITALKSPPWQDPRSILSDWNVETGARVWFSTGREQEGPLLGTSLPPSLVSFLTYSSLGAVSEETFARADHASGFFVKGNLGAGGINGGHLNDEDFPAFLTYSNTLSSASGHLGYATIDAGYSFLKTPDARLGAFVGYNYYAQGLNTFGSRQLAGDSASTGATGDPNFLGITKYTNLNSLRVGLSSQFMLNDRLRFTGDFAYLPSVSYSGVDDHLERQFLLPGATNTGNGVMLEAVLDYYITHNWSVGAGLRYWAWNAGLSASPFEFLANPASGGFQPEGHSVERYGVFLQASYRFGDDAPSESTLAVKAPTPASAPMNWSGVYVGGHFGGGFSNDRWSDPFGSTVGPSVPGFTGTNVAGFGDAIRATGALGGGQIGANWQTGAWVFGAQADLSATNITGQSSCFTGLGGVLCGRSIDTIGSFTGRVGYAWDRSLAYVKGGAAWTDTTYRVLGNTDSLTLGVGSTNLNTMGWTAGLGIEYALTNHWTTFAEYDHIGLPATNVALPNVAVIGTAPIAVTQSVDLFKVGMNYKFDGTATELTVKAPSLSPAPVSGWTGFYAGAELGAKWATSTWTTTSIVSTAMQNTPFPLDETSPQSFDFSGIRSGAYLGHNWQFAPQWVGGIELDWAYADTNTAAIGIPGCADTAGLCAAGFNTANDLATVKLGWDASARARMGYLLSPALLIYGTGGVAWQKIETSASCQFSTIDAVCFGSGNEFVTVPNSTIRTGWTIGGGVETKISENLIARAEYRYSDFGTLNDIQANLNAASAASPTNIAYQLKLHTQIATMGIAYQFGH